MSKKLAYVAVLIGAILWGTTGTAQTFMPNTIAPLTIASTRLAVGGFTLLIALLLMKKISVRGWPWKLTIIAGLAMALFQFCFFSSVRLTGVAIGTVVAIGSAPIFSGILEWVLLKKKPTKNWIIATVLSIIGCVLLFSDKEGMVVNPLGVALSLGAGLMFALYTLFNKKMLKQVDAVPAVAITFSISAAVLLPFLFTSSKEGILTVPGILGTLYLGLAATSIAYIIFSFGLQRISSSSAVTLSLAEPLTAAVLSFFVVGERLAFVSWIGVALLLGGIVVLTFGGSKEEKEMEMKAEIGM
ncbi:DME family drug/metabolite transporter [Sporosarcina luteola]|nr:DME family drug/metabolite transporter [Sporosarcina luteola]